MDSLQNIITFLNVFDRYLSFKINKNMWAEGPKKLMNIKGKKGNRHPADTLLESHPGWM